ncbi:MAG TPA: hypothetical protein VFA45_12060 [Actinomycetes bacterium]|jgi:hypothetical protein|nr:hypothetical protein [Actinomycetes bacterium]
MPDRVVVFLGYQNVYRRARSAFLLESGPPQLGQVDTLRGGVPLLVEKRADARLPITDRTRQL